MPQNVQTWRRKIRLQILTDIAKEKLESGGEISQIYEVLDAQMHERWKLSAYTRKLYLGDVKKILAGHHALTA